RSIQLLSATTYFCDIVLLLHIKLWKFVLSLQPEQFPLILQIYFLLKQQPLSNGLMLHRHSLYLLLGTFSVLEFDVLFLPRSEEHTSELQSRFDLVCRLLLEKKNK